RNDGGVLDAPDAPAFEVEDRHPQKFREVEELLRHPNILAPGQKERAGPDGCRNWVLHKRSTRLFDANSNMAPGSKRRKRKVRRSGDLVPQETQERREPAQPIRATYLRSYP